MERGEWMARQIAVGKTMAQMATELGISRQRMHQLCAREGLLGAARQEAAGRRAVRRRVRWERGRSPRARNILRRIITELGDVEPIYRSRTKGTRFRVGGLCYCLHEVHAQDPTRRYMLVTLRCPAEVDIVLIALQDGRVLQLPRATAPRVLNIPQQTDGVWARWRSPWLEESPTGSAVESDPAGEAP